MRFRRKLTWKQSKKTGNYKFHTLYKVPGMKGIHKFKRIQILNLDVYDSNFYESYVMGRLDQLPAYTDFTNLFDSYRVTGMKAKFLFDKNSAEVHGTDVSIPMIGTCTDKDDVAALTTENAFWQYEDFKYRRLDKPVSVFVKPRIAQSAYAGGIFASYVEGKAKQWIDCNSTTVEHYGIRYYIHCPGWHLEPHKIGILKIALTLWIECKNVR